MKRSIIKDGLGFVLVLSVLFTAGGSLHAQQVIDLFEGKQDVEPVQNLIVESVQSVSEYVLADGESSLQIDRGVRSDRATSGGSSIRLPFERFGGIIRVQAKVQGRPVHFLLDTGATYSTLTPAFAKELGLTPAAGNPKVMTNTANGLVESTFGTIPKLELGDRVHGKVTFTECESCGNNTGEIPSVGLLGLNVLKRYRMTIDDQQGFVELTPQSEFSNQRDDITPWLDIGFHEKIVSGGRVNRTGHVMKAKNLSAHAIQDVEVKWSCAVEGGKDFEAILKIPNVTSKGSSEATLPLPPSNCRNHEILLHRARW